MRVGSDLTCQFDQVVGSIAHGRNYYHHLVAAIKKAGENRDKIREAILATQGYKGVLGTFNFTSNGDGLHEVSVVQIEKSKPKLLKIVKVSAK